MQGRSKSFDQLLLDHRAAKEAALKAKQEAIAAAAAKGTSPMAMAAQSPQSSHSTIRALTGLGALGQVTPKMLKSTVASSSKLLPSTGQLYK